MITGGLGFIGTATARALMKNHMVSIYDIKAGEDILNQTKLEQFTGTYHTSGITYQDSQLGEINYANPTNYIHPVFSLLIVLAISTGAIGLGMWGLHKKQL